MQITPFNEIEKKNVLNEATILRRDFHQHPELSGQEYRTSESIKAFLKENGIEYIHGYAQTGVLAVIKGERAGATIALRADIDALPIQEQVESAYKSTKDNVMHACGHDAHTAMMLVTAKQLHDHRENIEGTVLCVFQPAEENAPTGGAAAMMEDGVFSHYQPDAILAQHVWPDLPVGTFGILEGPMMGNSDRFTITIKGSGGHASMPHQTNDAIIAAGQMIALLQTIVSRNVNPLDSAVVTIGELHAGERYNVIAGKAVLEGTVRTFSPKVKDQVKKRMTEIIRGLEEVFNLTIDMEYLDGYPATVNDGEWVKVIRQSADHLYGKESLPEIEPSLGGEDFARFLQQYPGAYYWLGTAIPEREVQKPLHDPSFDINEEALLYGVELMTANALNGLAHLNKEKERLQNG